MSREAIELLEKYGKHLPNCPRQYDDELNPCVCGLDQVLALLKKKPSETEITCKEMFEDMFKEDPRKTAVILYSSQMGLCKEIEQLEAWLEVQQKELDVSRAAEVEMAGQIERLEKNKKECRQILEKHLDRAKDPNDSLRDLVVAVCNALYWARAKKKHFVVAKLQAKIDQLEAELAKRPIVPAFVAIIKDDAYEKKIAELEAEIKQLKGR